MLKKEIGLVLLFPDGRPVLNQSELNQLRNDYSFTPRTFKNYRLNKVDIEANSLASSILFALGIPNEESIVSTGPVKLNSFPNRNDSFKARAVLTVERLVIFFQPRKKSEEFLVVKLRNIKGLTPHGPWSAAFSFRNGIHVDNSGAFEMADTYFELDEFFGKDGHENRRCVNLMDSLFKTLNEI